MPRLIRLAVALATTVLLVGCTVRTGSPEGDEAWHREVDQAVGAAVSSVGTTALVLDNLRNGHLTRSYAVLAVRDAVRNLGAESARYATVQPPAGQAAANQRAVRALGEAMAVLNFAATASAGGSDRERRDALREIRKTYRDLRSLRDQLAGAGR